MVSFFNFLQSDFSKINSYYWYEIPASRNNESKTDGTKRNRSSGLGTNWLLMIYITGRSSTSTWIRTLSKKQLYSLWWKTEPTHGKNFRLNQSLYGDFYDIYDFSVSIIISLDQQLQNIVLPLDISSNSLSNLLKLYLFPHIYDLITGISGKMKRAVTDLIMVSFRNY